MSARTISIDATPGPVAIDIARTAVLVVDMQNDFGAPEGTFARAGIDVSPIRRVVPSIARLLDCIRPIGIPAVYLKMAFPEDLSDAGSPDSPNRLKHAIFAIGTESTAPDGRKSRVLIRDTWNTDYHCILLADCAAEPIGNELSRTNHEASLLVIQTLFGYVSESVHVIEALQGLMRQQVAEGAL